MTSFSFDDAYLSPFTWRYGSAEMRKLWSEGHKRRLWRRIWVALAEAQAEAGLVTEAQVEDLRAHADQVDMDRAHEIESQIRHDLMAEVRTFAEQATVGGGIIHLGATSMDVQDNADAMRLGEATDLILARVAELTEAFAEQIDRWAETPTMAFTHLQPAEPTTIGYRLAQYGQDVMTDLQDLRTVRASLKGKGFKGATGTSASYTQLLADVEGFEAADLGRSIMSKLGIEAVTVATQVCPRKQEYKLLCALASLGQTLYKFAFDLRLLQSPVIGEWAEPFGKHQVGSSAMPFKRNPIDAENIDSITRQLAALPRVAWDNAAHTLLERTLDDSANRRTVLPQAFLIADEALRRALKLIRGVTINTRASERLMGLYGPFAATERLLMEAVKRGGDRQHLHEVIREHSLAAWSITRDGGENPLIDALCGDKDMLSLASAAEIRGWLDATHYVGDAPQRSRQMAQEMREAINQQA